jgi:hypothetical protein
MKRRGDSRHPGRVPARDPKALTLENKLAQ